MMDNLPITQKDMEQGTPCRCGSCGYKGRFDKMVDGQSQYDDACFINSHTGDYECHNCWLK